MPRSLGAYACEKAARETRRTLELLGYAGDDDAQETEHEGVQNSPELPPRSAAVEDTSEHCRQESRREEDCDKACSFGEFVEGGLPGLGASECSEAEEGTGTPAGFQDSLREWAIDHGIKRRPLTALLKLLRSRGGLSDLPNDGRTLLQTPRRPHEQFPIRTVEPGKYCHFGLAAGLQHALCHVEKLPAVLSLTFNIDGLPLSKSSKMQLWPIQCLVGGIDDVAPFLVGAFAGHSKPMSSNDFLVTFVEELQALLSQGVTVNGSLVQVKVRSIICDAPARAFITMTKGHGGYSGCPKCTVEGSYLNGRVVFLDMNCPLRTDLSFRQQHDAEHHKGESILLNLPINSVHDLPLDYMHLVLLGVMKKLLLLWTSGPLTVRWGPLKRHAFNEKSKQLRPHIPSEFPRKSRGLDEMDRWKAVEFRLVLFYTGPLLLKLCLTDRLYQHFLLLHASLSILANRQLCHQHANYAGELLRCFVSDFAELYGDHHVSFNGHGLIHLASDVQRMGELDSFSAFPFESNMQVLKKQLRKHGKPLEQLCNRIAEARTKTCRKSSDGGKLVDLSHPHCGGLLLSECCPPEYRMLTCGNFRISLSERDNCFLQDGHVVIARNIAHMKGSNEPCIIGQEFLVKEELYSAPFESSRLGISVVSHLSELKPWPLRNIQKMVKLPWDSKFVTLPELHTG
uniref:Uncharacterized protein n=1 Tax=Ixodes ricinus TaxID=34613 RepID=A0A6B0VGQ9_IXORI